MTRDEALKIVGRANSCQPLLGNMRKALEFHSFSNTDEEWYRLEACYTLLRTPHSKRDQLPSDLKGA